MTERNRWDSKRRSPLSDPRRGISSSASASSGSGRGSYDREKDRDRDRDHRRDRSYRHDKDKDKDNKKDRYHDNHSNHNRKHSSDSHRSDSRDRSSDSSNSHRSSRHDEHRGTSQDHRSNSSQHKSSYNHKHRDSPSNSSYSSSSYSTPPPAPPGPPPAPPSPRPVAHTPHILPPSQQHHIAPVGNAHLPHTMLHASAHPLQTGNHSSLYSSPHGVKSQQVGLPSSLHHIIHTIAPTVQNIMSHYQTQSNIYMDNSANHTTPSNRSDPRLSERRTSDPRRNATTNSAPIVEEVKKNFKLLIDPAIKKGHAKVIRYDGVLTGQPPVTPKDPRRAKSKIWTIECCDLPVPDMKIDKNYVGPMPKNIVRFSGLNDNINRKFLYELCEAYGDIKEYKVYFDPKTNKHLGTGKVVFEEKTRTDKIITALNNRQVMGSTITVWIDIKKPPGLSMLKQLQIECLKARPSQSGFMHHLNSVKRHMKTPQLSTPPTPKISAMNRNHPVAGTYNHTQAGYSSMETTGTQAGYSSMETTGTGGYYKNTNNPPPRVLSTPPPPPPKKHYEDISPTGREPDRNIYNNGQYLPYTNARNKSGLSLTVSRTKSTSYNSISNSKSGISPISPAVKELTPTTEKTMFPNYESISDNEHLPHVEDISPAVTPPLEPDILSSVKVKVESDDAMSLSSISSNEDSKVELNVSSQFLSQTSQTQIIQPVLIPVSDQLSTNQSVMNYITSAPLQHLFPAPLHPPPPCPPPQSHTPSQTHQPLQTHPPVQQIPPIPSLQPHQSPLQQSSPHQQPPLHQQSSSHSKTTSHHLPPQCPPTPIHQEQPPRPISYQQPPPQTHPPPQQYQHPCPPQNRPPSHQGAIDYAKYNPKAILQQQIYNNRTIISSHSNTSHSTNSLSNSTKNAAVKNSHSDSTLKTNYLNLRPSPHSVSEKHADIIRKALYGQNVAASGISNYSRNYNPTQPYPAVPPPVRQPLPIPKQLPFLFQVKSGVARDLSIELKRIIAKDTLKKLVEQSAFACFENWWEKQRTSKNKTIEIDKINPVSKFESNLTRKLLADKTTNISNPNTVQTPKDNPNTTSALLQNLFSRDKNNENRPPPSTPTPSKFLNTYRISRKQEAQTNMKVSHISRKRRPWPSLNQSKRKLQRLEDSEDEDMDDEEEETADEDNQFEQFAMKQRQKQKSGSSLYQKIYSDESTNEDDDDDGKEAQTQSEDEDEEAEKEEVHSSLSSSSSDSSTSSSSESEMSESETEEIIKEEPCNEDEFLMKSLKELVPCSVPVVPLPKHVELKTPSSPESETEEEVTEADDEIEPDEDEVEEGSGTRKVAFRSMYDEPRRRAVQDAERRMRELHAKLKGKKSKSSDSKVTEETDTSSDEEPTKEKKKTTEANKISTEEQLEPLIEKENETGEKLSSTESTSIEVEEESVVEDDSADDEPSTPINEEAIDEEQLVHEEEPNEDDLINNLIMFEHSYFFKSPSVTKIEPTDANDNRSEKFISKTLDSLIDSKRMYSKDLKHRFSMRTNQEETNIIWDIIKEGVDAEDLDYLKEAFESLVQIGAKEVENLCWVDHPITIIPPPKVKRGKAETKLRIHKSGSSRTEGYYNIPIAEKAQYLKSALKQLSIMQRHDIGMNAISTQAGTEHHKMKSRENRAMQRRLASSIAQEEYGTLMNYNQTLKMRKRALKFARSHIHNWGLFACEPIAAEEFVCEYIGQMIRSIVAEVREQRYEKSGIGSSYLFRLDMDSVIDATKIGCNARFVNHSCQPNCYAKVILVEGAKKIVIYSKRDIKLGEEITYDYKFPIEDDKIPCMCGAAQCRGSLN